MECHFIVFKLIHVLQVIVKPNGYHSGGAGYVLSKEALRRFATKGFTNASMCKPDGGAEDAAMGKCMQNLGVKLKPSVDKRGRSRFHCFPSEDHLQGNYPDWYLRYDANGAKWASILGDAGFIGGFCFMVIRRF